MKLRLAVRCVATLISAYIVPVVGSAVFVVSPFLTPAARADTLADATAAYVKGDYREAQRLLTPLAEMGKPGAETMLGGIYVLGLGTDKNCDAGIKLLSKAQQSGYPHAEFTIGKLHYTGTCYPKDHGVGLAMYNKAARKHDFDAEFALGLHYSDRTNAPQNLTEAYRWFYIAARDGIKYGGIPRNVQAAKNNVDQLNKILPPSELKHARALIAETFSEPLQ